MKITFTLLLFTTSLGLVVSQSANSQTYKYRNTLQGTTTEIVDPGKQRYARSLQEKIVNDGAILMSRDEVTRHLSGNTQQWSNGGAHYAPDGRLDYIWEGDLYNDNIWKVRGEGLVCITNPEGFTTSCSLYFNYKDTVWTVIIEEYGEKRTSFGGPDTILVGKNLDDLEPWDPRLSGNR